MSRIVRLSLCALTLVATMESRPALQERPYGVRTLSSEERAERERALEVQRAYDNGISVDDPKIYDDSMLQQMLRVAESKLAALQVLDQTGILSRVAALAGASQRISSVGVSVQTPQVAGVTTTNKGGGTTVASTATDSVSVDGKSSSSDVVQTTTTPNLQDLVTAAPAFGPPGASAPAATTALPSAFSVSASDALNEQMQLTYEIANLRLLLEGALSDHVMIVKNQRYVKPRVTLGFPIAIDAQARFRDAAAVVEVEIGRKGPLVDQKPSITALLPREKTYNVAAITDSSMSIGGGIATGIVGVSGSWLTGKKTHYVTQDQDTVALTYEPKERDKIGLRWQFRPVLGKRVIKSGLKQTFVQVAFPTELDPLELGTVVVRTYWVRYDAKKGTTKELVRESYKEYDERTIVPLPVASDPTAFNDAHLQDLGGGQMLVDVQGRFLSGSYLRIGGNVISEGPSARFEHTAVRFTATIADLATKRTAIVARDGTERALTIALARDGGGSVVVEPPTSATARIAGLDDGNVELTVELDRDVEKLRPRPILIVGSRAMGYLDAPVVRSGRRIVAVVPVSLVLANPIVTITSLFATYRVEAPIEGLTALSRTERIVLLEQGAPSRFLLYGNRLSTIKILEPANVTLGSIGRPADADTLRTFTLTTEQMKVKQIVLQRDNERPFLLATPPGDKAPSVKARDRVVVDSDAATFELDPGVDTAPKATWGTAELKVTRVDAKTLRVTGLKQAGTTATASYQSIEFTFAAGKSTATLEVINSRIESITR